MWYTFLVIEVVDIEIIEGEGLAWLAVASVVGTEDKLVLVLLHQHEEPSLGLSELKVSLTV